MKLRFRLEKAYYVQYHKHILHQRKPVVLTLKATTPVTIPRKKKAYYKAQTQAQH